VYRICFLAPGTSIHAKRWIEAMHHRGHRVLWVSTSPRPMIDTCVPSFAPFVGVREGQSRIPTALAYYQAYRKIRAFGADVVHMHYLRCSRAMTMLSRSWPRFVVSVWGSDIVPRPGTYRSQSETRRRRWMLARADAITATTAHLAERTNELLAAETAISVIPFGVDLTRFTSSERLGRSGRTTIGFLKSYLPIYGPDVLLKAMVLVKRKCPGAFLSMKGFRDPEPYRALAEELEIGDCVDIGHVVGHEQVPKELAQFDIFCMPSREESFGVAAIEASALGLPVVASNVGGIPEAVLDGRTGILVPPDNPGALAAALISLIENPDRARELGSSGRRHVEEHFDWGKNVGQMEDVYRGVMGSVARAPIRSAKNR